MDGAGEDICDVEGEYGRWKWSPVNGRGGLEGRVRALRPRLFTLAPGRHTVLFRGRKADTRLDRIIITNDRTFVPPGPDRG
jgi:hypothetical protein